MKNRRNARPPSSQGFGQDVTPRRQSVHVTDYPPQNDPAAVAHRVEIELFGERSGEDICLFERQAVCGGKCCPAPEGFIPRPIFGLLQVTSILAPTFRIRRDPIGCTLSIGLIHTRSVANHSQPLYLLRMICNGRFVPL